MMLMMATVVVLAAADAVRYSWSRYLYCPCGKVLYVELPHAHCFVVKNVSQFGRLIISSHTLRSPSFLQPAKPHTPVSARITSSPIAHLFAFPRALLSKTPSAPLSKTPSPDKYHTRLPQHHHHHHHPTTTAIPSLVQLPSPAPPACLQLTASRSCPPHFSPTSAYCFPAHHCTAPVVSLPFCPVRLRWRRKKQRLWPDGVVRLLCRNLNPRVLPIPTCQLLFAACTMTSTN